LPRRGDDGALQTGGAVQLDRRTEHARLLFHPLAEFGSRDRLEAGIILDLFGFEKNALGVNSSRLRVFTRARPQ
jgi:hypothetical protein